MVIVRGHVSKQIPKIKKDFGSGWVGQVSNWKLKKIGNIYFYTLFYYFLGEHSNVNSVICCYMLLFLLVVNYF